MLCSIAFWPRLLSLSPKHSFPLTAVLPSLLPWWTMYQCLRLIATPKAQTISTKGTFRVVKWTREDGSLFLFLFSMAAIFRRMSPPVALLAVKALAAAGMNTVLSASDSAQHKKLILLLLSQTVVQVYPSPQPTPCTHWH